MFPHLRVHSGDEQDRTTCGEQCRGQEVVGAPGRRARDQIGCRRSNDDKVGLLADAHVRDLVDVIEDGRGDAMSAQRLPRGCADESQRCRCRNDANHEAGLGEPAQQLTDFVCRDSTTDTQHEVLGGVTTDFG